MNTYRVYDCKNNYLFAMICQESMEDCNNFIKNFFYCKKIINFDTMLIANLNFVKIEFIDINNNLVSKMYRISKESK